MQSSTTYTKTKYQFVMAIVFKSEYRSLKLRLYPSKSQEQYFRQCCGCSRFVYNFYLAERQAFYDANVKGVTDKSERIRIWKTFKETPLAELKKQNPWMKDCDSQGTAFSVLNLKNAYKMFFGGTSDRPKFHKKFVNDSYTNGMMRQDMLDTTNQYVKIPKVGLVKFRHSKKLPYWMQYREKIQKITVSIHNEKFYISICFVVNMPIVEPRQIDAESQGIGLDFDCDDGFITNDGKSAVKDFGFRKFKQENKRLKHLQRQFARTKKGSNNRLKLRRKLANCEEHIANQRLDWQRKTAKFLTDNYDIIAVEDLNIKGMMKGSRNAKNYQDIAWGRFVTLLEMKGHENGCVVHKVDRFFASSQTCSVCGFKNKEVQQKHLEVWTCPNCGAVHQRDVNASCNILTEAIKNLSTEGTSGNVEKEQDFSCSSKDSTSVETPSMNLRNCGYETATRKGLQ